MLLLASIKSICHLILKLNMGLNMKENRHFIKEKVQGFIRKLYSWLLDKYFVFFEHQPTKSTCVVFAPHQDDETLGCGGTIIKKRCNGVPVKIVFMTDGNNSHKSVSEIDLKDIRRKEALASSLALGVEKENVIFLDYVDGMLSDNRDKALMQIKKILNDSQPQEIFIPYIGDTHPDHRATNEIVTSAIKEVGRAVITYEYPTWFLNNWLLVDNKSELNMYVEIKSGIKFMLSIFRDFRYCVNISDVISTKKYALNQHKSQVEKMVGSDSWPILGDISNGEWLKCFFHKHEIFYKRKWFFG